MYRHRALSGFLAVVLAAGTCAPSLAFAAISPSADLPTIDIPSIGGGNGGSSDEEVATEGSCGQGAVWSYDKETRALDIKLAEGATTGSVDVAGWAAWASEIDDVTVEEGITRIGAGVFAGQPLQTVDLADTVTQIGNAAFSACTSLSHVNGAQGVEAIGASAFAGCTALAAFPFSSSCESVGALAFSGSGLASLALPDGVTSVGDQAFASCASLASAELSDSLSTLGAGAFRSCEKLERVDGLDGLAELASGVFEGCIALSDVSLPEGVAKIGRNAFSNCVRAFSGGLDIPVSVATISDGAFQGCNAVSLIEFPGDAPAIASTAFSNIVAKAVYPQGNATWTKSAKRDYGGDLTWCARENDGSLVPDKYNTGYRDEALSAGVAKDVQFNDQVKGYAFRITVPKATSVRFDFSWNLPCTHNYFNIAVVDSSGDEVMQADAYQSFLGSDCSMTRNQTLAAGTYRIVVSYRVGHSGQEASFNVRYSADSPYADVPSGAWYYDAVCQASADGLMTGYGNGLFGPADTLTRAQAATILWRYFNPTAAGSYAQDKATNRTKMRDVEDGAFYTEAANWAVERGVVHGVEKDGELVFDPDASIPRSQLCVMIANAAAAFCDAKVDAASRDALDAMPDATDVPEWAAASIAWCLDSGVISGVNENGARYVRPAGVVDRATMAQAMENALAAGALAR